MSEQTRKLAAIVYTDLARFSELSATDETRAIELVNLQREIIHPIIDNYNGILHKETGDGFLLTFPTVTSAVEFAIEFQRAVKKVDGLNVRIGIHEGEITVQNNDIFGDDVNIGSRIEPYSPVGGVAISDKVQREISSLAKYKTELIGEPELKGIKQPVKIYCISSHNMAVPIEKSEKPASTHKKQGFKFNILNLTGITLTIIGGAFWIWYGLGNISRGSDLDLNAGIRKSIAVFNFENLSSEKTGEYLCSAITEGIRTALAKLGKLDVKSRLISLKMKNDSPELENALDVDYFVEGSLSSISKNRQINVSLVNAKTGNNVWSNQYTFSDSQIIQFQDSILRNITANLEVDFSSDQTNIKKTSYTNASAFQFLGKGIYHYDNNDYQSALSAFDTAIVLSPDYLQAYFHKANTYYKIGDYNKALNIYQNILGQSRDINHINWEWVLPEFKNVNQTYFTGSQGSSRLERNNENIAFSKTGDSAVILVKGKKECRLIALDLQTQDIIWENLINDQFAARPVINNNIVFISSNRISEIQGGEPALYGYDLNSGRVIIENEFPREYPGQVVLLEIMEGYSRNREDNLSTLLLLTMQEEKQFILLNNKNGKIIWKNPINIPNFGRLPMRRVYNGKEEFLVFLFDNDILVLNENSGDEFWSKKFPGECRLRFWDNKILYHNKSDDLIALWDPIKKKELWNYSTAAEIHSLARQGGFENQPAVALASLDNGDLLGINADGGIFNWRLQRWSRNIGDAKRIWFQNFPNNRVHCLTSDDSLFTIKLDDGKIINSIKTDRHDYHFYGDTTLNAIILVNSQFIMGVDPLNGDQLWKIKETDTDQEKQVQLFADNLLVAKVNPEDSVLLINNYNRDNGNLLWSQILSITRTMNTWHNNKPFSNPGLNIFMEKGALPFYLIKNGEITKLIFHDSIIEIKNLREIESETIKPKEVKLQMARSYSKLNKLEKAEFEYSSLLSNYDQMNQDAYWELAGIYQSNNLNKEAIEALLNYYDLVLPSSKMAIATIQKLKEFSGLRWVRNIDWDDWDNANLLVDKERIYRYLHNTVEAYRMSSGTKIWQTKLKETAKGILLADVQNNNSIFMVSRHKPSAKSTKELILEADLDWMKLIKQTHFQLMALSKKTGEAEWENVLALPGDHNPEWLELYKRKLFLGTLFNDSLTIAAYDIKNGELEWAEKFSVPEFSSVYNLQTVFYNDILLLPLGDKITYIQVGTGGTVNEFIDEDMEQIVSFNKNGLQENEITFFIENIDYEYIVLNLDNNTKVDQGTIDLEYPLLSLKLNDLFYDFNAAGYITAYRFDQQENSLENIWDYDFNKTISFTGNYDNQLYLLDMNGNDLRRLDAQSGEIFDNIPLLWPAVKIGMEKNHVIVQSEKNLYLISL